MEEHRSDSFKYFVGVFSEVYEGFLKTSKRSVHDLFLKKIIVPRAPLLGSVGSLANHNKLLREIRD